MKSPELWFADPTYSVPIRIPAVIWLAATSYSVLRLLGHDQHRSLGASHELISSFVVGTAPLKSLSRHFKMSSIHRRMFSHAGWRSPSTIPNIIVFSKRLSSIRQMCLNTWSSLVRYVCLLSTIDSRCWTVVFIVPELRCSPRKLRRSPSTAFWADTRTEEHRKATSTNCLGEVIYGSSKWSGHWGSHLAVGTHLATRLATVGHFVNGRVSTTQSSDALDVRSGFHFSHNN